MNFQVLPYLKPLSTGLAEFAKAKPEFKFLVEHGGKINPPRTPRRLIAHLLHTFRSKKFTGYNLNIETFQMPFMVRSAYDHIGHVIGGMSGGVLRISYPGIKLDIAFSKFDDTYAQISKIEYSSPA